MEQAVQEKKEIRIGDYRLTGKIGQGGAAVIYKGRQESLDRDVAIKVLSSKLTDDQEIVRRFERESMVVAKLNHPNIVHVIDKGFAGGRYYFVMTYIEGTSLREVIESERIQLKTKLEMIVQVCKALDYAHKNGVIHRDIKPSNILIDKQGNALVADFGIAQIIGTPDTEMTSSDVIMGTLAYMSPEQKISSTNVDQTTDIYAVGVILYEILVGKKPLGHFKLPSEINNEIEPKFDNIVLKCLAQESKDRFQRAVELKDAILNAIGGFEGDTPPDEFSVSGADSFMGKCRYLDTIKETRYNSTILVENKVNKKLYVIKKHSRGEHGRKEAKLLSNLKHENIINIYGSGGDKKNTVIITEYASGGCLSDRMARKHEWQKGMELIIGMARGLDHAHKNNIVHGNLRPSNILFDSEDQPKITDFGMPAHYENFKKKNWYNPPEHKISKLGDIYALGVIAHQMLTGRNPSYDNAGNLRLDDVKYDLPSGITDMLKKFLAIRVVNRYNSCEEFLAEYEEFTRNRLERVTRKPADKPVEDKPRTHIPVWAYVAAAAIFALTILATLFFSGFFK